MSAEHKPLSECYIVVTANRYADARYQHAVWMGEDKTMCGQLQVLDVNKVTRLCVTCGDCLLKLKKERQRRSRAEAAERKQYPYTMGEDEGVALLEEQKIEQDDEANSVPVVKRWLLFCGEYPCPSGGWSDYQGSADTQEEIEALWQKTLTERNEQDYVTSWHQKVDTMTGSIHQ